MTDIQKQEEFIDSLKKIEDMLFNIRDGLYVGDELDEAWYIVYNRLKREQKKK